jgi:beta-galactosidase/beta-glucuronidase
MRKFLFVGFLVGLLNLANAQAWKPAGDKIKTQWAEKVDAANPLSEYPRPQMVRDQWQNLNGQWDYAIIPKGNSCPEKFDGKILVPFAAESALSGVQKKVGDSNELWYSRTFAVSAAWKNKRILLNFGAVDWKADVWLNDIKIGSHQGGYTPFSFDITAFLSKEKSQKLVVRVWDPTNNGFQPRGKQVNNPGGIMYTAVTGIWQTVWLEPVDQSYISRLKTIPNIDGNNVSILAATQGALPTDVIEVKVLENGIVIGTGKAAAGQEVSVAIPQAKLWSPESPYLYDMEVAILRNGVAGDK